MFYESHAAIRLPIIEGKEYEIDPEMITLVKQNQFRGLSSESPTDHIEDFDDLCSITTLIGMPPDYLSCKLFLFSLSDKAHRWLKSLPPGSITSWEECRTAFLKKIFIRARSIALKNMIATFEQDRNEYFYKAWDHFKEYLRDCPHHNYWDADTMSFFYNMI
ncbi:hypothetical protein V5N11_018732 [Cardamine amara subsp. amara]|uniref:Retrotransposon gag domain-containing protein n=1 Tax=Cardamine amara subsp. amara TaxID=228776 RepID=A0ABD1BDD5_CARAN